MKTSIITTCAVFLALLTSGCLTRRTVSEGGHTISQEYVIERPLKEALENPQ
jgi:hypothetical protein